MVKLKVCHSEHVDTKYALKEIVDEVKLIPNEQIKAAIVFADIEFDLEEIRSNLTSNFPDIKIVGGTSYGEMSSTLGWREDSLVVGFLYGDEFSVNTFSVEDISQDLGKKLAPQFSSKEDNDDAKLCILVSDAFSIGGETIIKNVREYLPREIPIIGGMSADQWTFIETKQISEKSVYTNGLVGLIVSGNFNVGISTSTGWEPKGKKAIVTKSEGNVVSEINNIPALDFYAQTFGTKNGTFGEYPLAMYIEGKVAYFRAPLKWDIESGVMTFAGAVPEGSEVAISTTTREQALKASIESTEEACAELQGEPDWAFVTSCAARRQLLGTQAELEIKNTLSVIKYKPVLGFNSYGEFLDVIPKYPDTPGFLNESFCVVTIGKE